MKYKHEITQEEIDKYYAIPLTWTARGIVYVEKNSVGSLDIACSVIEHCGGEGLPPKQDWEYCGDHEVDDDLLDEEEE